MRIGVLEYIVCHDGRNGERLSSSSGPEKAPPRARPRACGEGAGARVRSRDRAVAGGIPLPRSAAHFSARTLGQGALMRWSQAASGVAMLVTSTSAAQRSARFGASSSWSARKCPRLSFSMSSVAHPCEGYCRWWRSLGRSSHPGSRFIDAAFSSFFRGTSAATVRRRLGDIDSGLLEDGGWKTLGASASV